MTSSNASPSHSHPPPRPQMPTLPGFVWDADRQRYFRIPPSHAHASLASAAAPPSVLMASTATSSRKKPHRHGRQPTPPRHSRESSEPLNRKRKKQRTRESSPPPNNGSSRHPPTLFQLLRLRQFAPPTVDQLVAVSAAHQSGIRSSSVVGGKEFESFGFISPGSWQLGLAEPSIIHVPVHSDLVPNGYCLGSSAGSGVFISTLSDGSLSARSASGHGSHTLLHIPSTAGRGTPNSLHYNPTSHSLILSTLPSHSSRTAQLQVLQLPPTFPSISSSESGNHTLHLPIPAILCCPRDRTIHTTHASPTILAAGGSKCVLVWDANTLQPLNAFRPMSSVPHPIPLRSDAFAIHCMPHPSLLLAGQRDGWLSLIDIRTCSTSRPAASHAPPAAIASKPKRTYDHRPTHLPTWPVSSILTDTLGSTYAVFRGGHVAEYIPGYGQHLVHVADEALEGECGFEVAMRQCAAGVDPVGGGVVCARPARRQGGWVYVLAGNKVAEVEGPTKDQVGVASALVVIESVVTGRPMVVSISTAS